MDIDIVFFQCRQGNGERIRSRINVFFFHIYPTGTIDTRITSLESPQQPLASTNVPPQQPNTIATTSPPQNPITPQDTSSSNRDAKDVTVDELTEMTRELDKTLTPDPAVSSSDNGSESLSMLSQNEIEALILKQYRSNNDKLGSDLASTSGINQRSIADTDLILEEEYVTPRPVVDRDPADWTVQVTYLFSFEL